MNLLLDEEKAKNNDLSSVEDQTKVKSSSDDQNNFDQCVDRSTIETTLNQPVDVVEIDDSDDEECTVIGPQSEPNAVNGDIRTLFQVLFEQQCNGNNIKQIMDDATFKQTTPRSTPTSRPKQAKGFNCSFCEHVATTKQNLKRHIQIHTSKKSYQCNVCYKNFVYSTSLRSHMETHTGEKLIKQSLMEHMQHHIKNILTKTANDLH